MDTCCAASFVDMGIRTGFALAPEGASHVCESCGAYWELRGTWRRVYRCPRCSAVSYNLNDLAERYCGRCHQFEEP